MATVAYLDGGERPTADLMNDLWGRFESKLARICAGGRSFFLARDAQVPAGLLGKIFYFTSGDPADLVYSLRAPGPTSGGNPLAYDHSIFEDYIAGIDPDDPSLVWDDANRIVTIPRVADVDYGDLELPGNDIAFGFFEHSLQAHTIDHTGEGDTEPHPYFIRDGEDAPPEKRFRFALAEIIIEGPDTSVNLPIAWDKYSCFRIHNCNGFAVTVTFDDVFELTLNAFECRVLRRDDPEDATSYRSEAHFFFSFEPGDPRCFWYLPTKGEIVTAVLKPIIALGPRAANAMAANNLTNASLLLDWCNWLAIDADSTRAFGAIANGVLDNGDGTKRYAWFNRDRAIAWDAHALNAVAFGDPSNTATLLGDLIHHKGRIVIARISKTEMDPDSGLPIVTWDEVTFNGYATIVADFAAHQLSVAENGDGDLTITNDDPDNDVDLIPVGTNLFKSWDDDDGELLPTVINLNAADHSSTPFTIENAVFENPPDIGVSQDFKLRNTAPGLIYQRGLNTIGSNSRSYTDVDLTDPMRPLVTQTVDGPDLHYISSPDPPATRKVLHGIHAITVADILKLDWWGDKDLADQATDYVSFDNVALKLTTEGLLLTWNEVITIIPPAVDNSGDWFYWQQGIFSRPRAIRFRGHGWGYNSALDGSQHSAFHVPRYGIYTVTQDYIDEIEGISGVDFSVTKLNATESGYKVLHRIKTSMLQLAALNARFWKAYAGGPNAFLEHHEETDWYWTHRGALESGGEATEDLRAPALLPEHYNALATAVNQLTTGSALTGAALFWRHPSGRLVSLATTHELFPVPMDCWASFGENDDLAWLADHLGIAIKGEADFPDDLTEHAGEMSLLGIARFTGSITGGVTAVNVVSIDGTPDGSMTASYTIDMDDPTAMAVDTIKDGAGDGLDPHYLGTWTPSGSPPDFTGAAVGDYYVVASSGFDGLNWWLKGDLALNLGTGKFSAAAAAPAWAYIPATGNWVQLRPDSVGNVTGDPGYSRIAPPTIKRFRGTLDPSGGLPPTSGAIEGDYYKWSATVGGYLKGGRIIFDGIAWQPVNHTYADFNWITTADVKAWLEDAGFDVVLNELVIPLALERQVADQVEVSDDSVLSASGDVTMTAVGFIRGTSPTGTALQAAQHVPLTLNPYANLLTRVDFPGSRLQFSTVESGAQWKLRLDWWELLADVGSPLTADLKNWTTEGDTDRPPVVAFDALAPGYASSQSNNWTGVGFGGWQVEAQLGINDLPPMTYLGPIQAPNGEVVDTGGTTFAGLSWINCPELVKGPISETTPYQFAAFAVYSFNSAGVDSAIVAKVVPIGSWNFDGDFFRSNADALVKFGYFAVLPSKWFDAAGSTDTITASSSGLTYITPPAGSVAYLLAHFHGNSVAL